MKSLSSKNRVKLMSAKSSIRASISKVMKTIYKEKNSLDESEKLEKSVLELSNRKYISSSLSKKRHSRTIENSPRTGVEIDIINLPKLPFGTHKPYNQNYSFIQRHFLSKEFVNQAKTTYKSTKITDFTRACKIHQYKTSHVKHQRFRA